jgi:hypothetical protein
VTYVASGATRKYASQMHALIARLTTEILAMLVTASRQAEKTRANGTRVGQCQQTTGTAFMEAFLSQREA